MRKVLFLLLLPAPALAQTFVVDGPCLPEPLVLPIENPVLTDDDGSYAIWSFDAVPTSAGTFEGVYVENDGTFGDQLQIVADVGDFLFFGPSTAVDHHGVPQTLSLAPWSFDALYSGPLGDCSLTAASSSIVDGVLTYTLEGSCLPTPIVIPLENVQLASTDAVQTTWSFDPISTSQGTFSTAEIENDVQPFNFDGVLLHSDVSTIALTGPDDIFEAPAFPTSLEIEDWIYDTHFDGPDDSCTLTTLTTLGDEELVQTTIGDTPGFEDVLDSGPTNLSSTTIQDRMEALEDAAGSCTTERWAGTWVRGRSPRLQGETEGGAAITGSSITAATVDGSPFSASLATGGRIVGTTDAGSLEGYFARISSRKAIWYAVETSCP